MDIIGEIQPNSSTGYRFRIMALDCFTKWVEVKPMRMATQKDIITFVGDSIIHHFGIPEMITTDKGTMFTDEQFSRFLESRQIKLLNSPSYYAQTNGHAEVVNMVIINTMKWYIRKHSRKWNEKLLEVLWESEQLLRQ